MVEHLVVPRTDSKKRKKKNRYISESVLEKRFKKDDDTFNILKVPNFTRKNEEETHRNITILS